MIHLKSNSGVLTLYRWGKLSEKDYYESGRLPISFKNDKYVKSVHFSESVDGPNFYKDNHYLTHSRGNDWSVLYEVRVELNDTSYKVCPSKVGGRCKSLYFQAYSESELPKVVDFKIMDETGAEHD